MPTQSGSYELARSVFVSDTDLSNVALLVARSGELVNHHGPCYDVIVLPQAWHGIHLFCSVGFNKFQTLLMLIECW